MLRKEAFTLACGFPRHKSSKEYGVKRGKTALSTSLWPFSRNFLNNLKWPKARIIESHAEFVGQTWSSGRVIAEVLGVFMELPYCKTAFAFLCLLYFG